MCWHLALVPTRDRLQPTLPGRCSDATGGVNMLPATACKDHIVCTIGHSTHPLDAFVAMLKANEVGHVLDVRTVPRSRHNPQFNSASLPGFLKTVDISYTHVPALGGLRRTRAD